MKGLFRMPSVCALRPPPSVAHSAKKQRILSTPFSSISWGVVFDVDGVLTKSGKPIEGALKALRALPSADKPMNRVPHLFVTNGGGYLEKKKALAIGKSFDLDIDEDKVIVSHTPVKLHAEALSNKHVLVVASDEKSGMNVAAAYGIKHATSIQQYASHHPLLFPMKYNAYHRTGDMEASDKQAPVKIQSKVDVVWLLSEPEDWGETLQILVDVLRSSDGIPGGKDLTPGEAQQTQFFLCNPDFVYSAQWPVPRFTQGAFLECLKHLYTLSTRRELDVTLFGKPFPETYVYAEKELSRQHALLSNNDGTALKTIYAIGDNPLSDVAGANAAGEKWFSILVQTGCHTDDGNCPDHPAKHVCKDVQQAVEFILEREANRASCD